MTDKANVEIPSPRGTVLSLGGEVGQTLAVGSELIRIEVADADSTHREAPPAAAMPASLRRLPRRRRHPPAPCDLARHWPHTNVDGRCSTVRSLRRRCGAEPRSSDVDLRELSGTGPRRASCRPTSTPQSHGAPRRPQRERPVPTVIARDDEQAIPVIACGARSPEDAGVQAPHPHFTYVEEIDVTELEALRAGLNVHGPIGAPSSPCCPSCCARWCGRARIPAVNARFDDEAASSRAMARCIRHRHADRGGLLVPVLRHAEALDLWGLPTSGAPARRRAAQDDAHD